MSFCKNPRFSELLLRVLGEPGLENDVADIIYLFGQTPDNEDSVLTKAVEVYNQRRAKLIGFSTEKSGSAGYAGFQHWKDSLITADIPENIIVGINLLVLRENFNTLSEAEALIKEAKIRNWKKAYITAPAFHLPRAFITTISVVLREYPQLKVYSLVGIPLDWNERVRHSQGTTVGTRTELIMGELERIDRYHAKGDLVSLEKIFNYLGSRDTEV